ncbi:MAG TPA: PAS domain-containing protein, partial [Pirellulaceae bacterium]
MTTTTDVVTPESLSASLVDDLPVFVTCKDEQGRITYVNRRLADLLGRPVTDILGKTDFDFFPQALAQKYRNDDLCVMQTGSLFVDVEEHVSEGKTLYFEVRKSPVRSGTGRIVGIQAIFWDVTEKRTAEEALKFERFLLHSLMHNIPDSIYFKDEESRFLRVSRMMADKFRVPDPAAILGKTDADFFSDEHACAARQDELRVMETGQPILGKIEREDWADGRVTWCSTTKMPLRDARGRTMGTLGVTRDITEQMSAELALERERDLLRTLTDHLPDLIYVKDTAGRYLLVNEAVRNLLGLTSVDDVKGKTNAEFVAAEQAHLEQQDDIEVLTTGVPLIEREERSLDRDGRETWFLTSKVPIKDAQGNVHGLVGIDRNITRLKRTEEDLRRAKEAADAANRAKSDFLANVSHEIRTPMNAIIGMTELLLDTRLSDLQREYLTIVQQSGESLLSLINDILDFSKIEAGKLDLDEAPFDLREGIGNVMKSLAVRAHAKGLELAFRIDRGVPNRLRGDLGRLRQIVMNLVGNAVKFTERGEVVLQIRGVHVGQEVAELLFSVSDTGIGIPPDKRAKVFEEFEQVDASITRRFGGTGLGLAISSRLVNLMGGSIDVESEPGQGSTFSFTAKLAIESDVSPESSLPRLSLTDRTVLVVDDNATNRRIVQDMVGNWGMRPVLAENATQALHCLRLAGEEHRPFDLVISDVNMPDVDGFTLVARIHELPGTVPPVILLTSGIRVDDIGRSKELGVAAHLMKPVK